MTDKDLNKNVLLAVNGEDGPSVPAVGTEALPNQFELPETEVPLPERPFHERLDTAIEELNEAHANIAVPEDEALTPADPTDEHGEGGRIYQVHFLGMRGLVDSGYPNGPISFDFPADEQEYDWHLLRDPDIKIIGISEIPFGGVEDAVAFEGDPLFFQVALSFPTNEDILLNMMTIDGTATGGEDFEITDFRYSTDGGDTFIDAIDGTIITIIAGTTSTILEIDTFEDSIDEVPETMSVKVAEVVSGTVGDSSNTARGIILDTTILPPELSLTAHTEDGAIKEDTSTEATLSAITTGSSDSLLEVKIFGLEGWTVDFSALENDPDVDEVTFVDGTLCIKLNDSVNSFSGDLVLTPPADSDIDLKPTLEATVSDGNVTLTFDESSVVTVDAVADDATVNIDLKNENGEDDSFVGGEKGSLNANGEFGDNIDGSETHEVIIVAGEGYTFTGNFTTNDGNLDGPPSFNMDNTEVTFYVATGEGETGVYDVTFEVMADFADVDEGEPFKATATATETPSDTTADPSDNVVIEMDTDGENVNFIGELNPQGFQFTLEDLLKEDGSAIGNLILDLPTVGDTLSSVTLTAPDGWSLDAEVGGQILAVSGSGTNVLTLTLDDITFPDSLNVDVDVMPPEDTDVDGVVTASGTIVDGNATLPFSKDFDVPVDAILDEKAEVTQTGGTVMGEEMLTPQTFDLNLDFSLVSAGFTGSLEGGPDTDGSEIITNVTIQLTADDLTGVVLQFDGSEPASANLTPNGDGNYTLTANESDYEAAIESLQVMIPGGFDGGLTGSMSITREEANTPEGEVPASGDEPDETDNQSPSTDSFDFEIDIAANNPPDAVNDLTFVDQNSDVIIKVLNNDSDPDGDLINIINTTDPSNGSIVTNPDGTITYTPGMDFTGFDTFTYTISDGRGGEDTATVTVSVNAPPTILNGDIVTNTNQQNQEMRLTFMQANDPTIFFSMVGVLDSQGQQKSFAEPVGFVIDPREEYIVTVEYVSGTKVLVKDFTLENVDIVDPNDGINLGDGTSNTNHAMTAVITPEGELIIGPTISTDSGGTDDTINTGNTTNIPYIYANGGDDTLTGGDGTQVLDGNSGNDTLSGGAGNDILKGGSGDDILNGDADDDLLEGGPGADDIDGGTGIDTAEYFESSAGVTIDLNDDTNNAGGDALGDTYTDVENLIGSNHNDMITGDSGDNVLKGLDGDDTIFGNGGNDTITGGNGADTLDGGAGNDVFAYIDPLDGGDIINNFEADSDIVSLDNLFDGLLVPSGDRDELVQLTDNGGNEWTVEVDTNGDSTFDTLIATVNTTGGDLVLGVNVSVGEFG